MRCATAPRAKERRGEASPGLRNTTTGQTLFRSLAARSELNPGGIRLPKIGWLRVRGMNLPNGADMKQVAATQEPNGWHASIQFDAPAKSSAPTLPMVGIDAGLNHLAILSDGTKIAHPRLARKATKRLRRLNRERDRRRKGSVNRKRTVVRLGRAHRALGDARKDAMHKATRKLVDTYDGFAVEDLSLRGMMRTRMAGSLADAGLGEFIRTLHYKAEWAGRSWHVHGRFVRSTGICPDCGHIGEKLALSVRSWVCDSLRRGSRSRRCRRQGDPGWRGTASGAGTGGCDAAKARLCRSWRGSGIRSV